MNPVGLITAMLCAVRFATYACYGKAAARRGLSSWTTMFYGFALSTLPIALLPAVPGGVTGLNGSWPQLTLEGWLLIAALVVGSTISGFGLFALALSYLPAGIANLSAALEPVLTTIEAYLRLGERLSRAQLIGSLPALTAVLLVRPTDESTVDKDGR